MVVCSKPVLFPGGPFPKRFRPPKLNLPTERRTNTIVEPETPIVVLPDDEDDGTSSQSSSASSSSPIGSITQDTDSEPVPDDISKDLADLERLRQSVRQNLRLRPIRSSGALPKVDPQRSPFRASSPAIALLPSSSNIQNPSLQSASPSVYFTPLSENYPSPIPPPLDSNSYTDPSYAVSTTPSLRVVQPLDPGALFDRLMSSKYPMLIDARSPPSHLAFRIKHSINIVIPSLILKRCRKPGGGLHSLDALRQFITTEQGKATWDDLIRPGGSWDNDIIVYAEEGDKDDTPVSASPLIPLISPLLTGGTIYYLKGGISAARDHRRLRNLMSSGGDYDFGGDAFQVSSQIKKGSGLFQLDIESAEKRSNFYSGPAEQSASTPLPTTSNVLIVPDTLNNVIDSSPSPPPSQLVLHLPRNPSRRPSVPNLRRIDTKSAERLNANLPKLQMRNLPNKSATLSLRPLRIAAQSHSPSHLSLVQGDNSPPSSAACASPLLENESDESQTTPFSSYFTPLHSPVTPMPILHSPATARPELDPIPTTDDRPEEFVVSAILPNFLFLGPEVITQDHVEEIRDLGIKRILNMAAECDDDRGLRLKEVFERYVKIPWRDTVEEENITKGVRDVCDILDDARLHSAPTYVHCKAGKSRSVTAVMAYLIHANHWTLSQAYTFVVERRKGISPNIGFVSELMTFEEEELGGKSNGVQPPNSSEQIGDHDVVTHGSFAAASNRRAGHIRESLPPVFVTQNSEGNFIYSGPMSADPMSNARVGDSGQEMEIKDSFGRYRHARRAPVDEQTLQPLRRVSKAGLESAMYT